MFYLYDIISLKKSTIPSPVSYLDDNWEAITMKLLVRLYWVIEINIFNSLERFFIDADIYPWRYMSTQCLHYVCTTRRDISLVRCCADIVRTYISRDICHYNLLWFSARVENFIYRKLKAKQANHAANNDGKVNQSQLYIYHKNPQSRWLNLLYPRLIFQNEKKSGNVWRILLSCSSSFNNITW